MTAQQQQPQTRLHSLLESLNAAAFAAPTAIGLHKLSIFVGNDCVLIDSSCNDLYVGITWIAFFLHSIMWKYVIRRIHEKYDVELNPYNLSVKMKARLLSR